MSIKAELRKKYKLIRSALDAKARLASSERICMRIAALEQYKTAKTVLCYSAINTEVSLDLLVKTALADDKMVLLPVTDAQKGIMYAAPLGDMNELVQGSYGIGEPSIKCEFDVAKIDMVIVPALVYNRVGYRIGYGKGYYDRFFTSCENALKIGAAYSCQISDEDFAQAHDVCVDMIVTDEEVICCNDGQV